ncbi:hypothetical protein ACNKHR_13040 [Shigella flexneri]
MVRYWLIAIGQDSFMQGIEQVHHRSRREIKLNRWPINPCRLARHLPV